MVRRIKKRAPGAIVFCYEAGVCGFALKRQIEKHGVRCDVIAPSLTPRKPGQRVKTNRRDARKLAFLHRAGLLTVVSPPNEKQEAGRDLCRCRDDARDNLMRARHRLLKFLLRRGMVYRDGSHWTQKHFAWLRSLRFEERVDVQVFTYYLVEVEQQTQRLADLSRAVEALAEEEPYKEPVGWLRCFRGIDTIAGMTIVTELHGFGRFTAPRRLMGFLGLTPSEHSSMKTKKGGITKTGNGHVRRMLIEVSWHYRHYPLVGPTLRKRREGQPEWVIAIADQAQQRLHRRYHHLVYRGKPPAEAVTAVARELVGFVWAVLSRSAMLCPWEGSAAEAQATELAAAGTGR